MADDALPQLLPALRALQQWLAASKTPYLIIGGAAVALIGRPRTTLDVDAVVLIDEDELASFLSSGSAFGFRPRIRDPLDFARKARILMLIHEPSRSEVDMSLAGLEFERQSIERGNTVAAGGIELRVPRVEDLIIMKAVASRELDFADIDTLLDVHPRVDRRRIRRWVREFAEALDNPEITQRVEVLLRRKRLPTKDG